MASFRTWDFNRFWKTLTFFEVIPVLSWVQTMFYASPSPSSPQPQTGVIFDFAQPGLQINQIWGAVDDVVMGGVSTSGIRLEAGNAVFSGLVSTDNNGGFASVRTRNFDPPLDLSGKLGVTLRVKGDGQRYKFLTRDDGGWDSVAFAYSFDTVKNQWITVRIPFDRLVPVMRAKTVKDGRSLDSSRIRALQLMLSKFEYDGVLNPAFVAGEFRLEVAAIACF
ncbi:MAG: CIA30 family protein [Synechococcales cyanobacterium CRU_2_2]|nr:CIA30 family protein [Synechococcales cyanobacterium CRU_2_2]